MKKIFVLVLMLLLCISASNAQAFSLTDTISSAVTSITNFFKDIGNIIGIKSPSEKNDADYIIDTSDSFADFASISGWWNNDKNYKDKQGKIDCDKVKKNAGKYADASEEMEEMTEFTPPGGLNIDPTVSKPTTIPTIFTPPGGLNIDPTISIPKTDSIINPGINPIDNVNTSSIKNLIYVNTANAVEYRLGKDPCKELERDMKAAEKRAKNSNSDSAKREARKANTNMQEAYNKCCLKVGGGDGGGGDLLPKDSGKTPVPTVTIPSPDITVPIDEPPSDTKPPEYAYVCDFTSPSFNHMYNCIVKQGDYTIDDIQCNPSENKSFKDYQSVTKKFLGLIPYTTIEEKELFYNPVCVKPPEVPPIDEPPITTPTKPTVPIGNPDETIPTTPTTKEKPIEFDPHCNIRILQFYDKDANMTWDQDDTYSIFSKPEDGILSNPRLEYIAENCKNCKLEITPTVDEFIDDNPNVFGVLKGVLDLNKEGKEYLNRYTFLRLWEIYDNAISLNITNLTPDKYTITLTCTGPENEYQTETLRLNIYPQMRWREVVPVINH